MFVVFMFIFFYACEPGANLRKKGNFSSESVDGDKCTVANMKIMKLASHSMLARCGQMCILITADGI